MGKRGARASGTAEKKARSEESWVGRILKSLENLACKYTSQMSE